MNQLKTLMILWQVILMKKNAATKQLQFYYKVKYNKLIDIVYFIRDYVI